MDFGQFSVQLKYFIIKKAARFVSYFYCKSLTKTGELCQESPLIVCGTHFNCLLDGSFLQIQSDKKISFLTSSHSINQFPVGYFINFTDPVPVNRPMDKRYPGLGLITIDSNSVSGQDTKFLSQLKKGDYLAVDGNEFRVSQVVSDTHLIILQKKNIQTPVSFKIYPQVDNAKCMNLTLSKLKKGENIGLFPEGETHEEPALILIKPGIAKIVQECWNQGFNPAVQCFSYYLSNPKSYRGRCELILGKPWKFDTEMKNLENRECVTLILEKIKAELELVMLPADTFEEVELGTFIAKLKRLKGFENNRSGVVREVLKRLKGFDGVAELIEQMKGIKKDAVDLGVSKYYWEKVGRNSLSLALVIGAGIVLIFGFAIGFLMVAAWLVECLVNKNKEDVLRKLPYRKTVVDCLNTWRATYILAGSVLISFICFILFIYSGWSSSSAGLGVVFIITYAKISVNAYDAALRVKKTINTFNLQETQKFLQLIAKKKAFVDCIDTKISLLE